MSSKAPSLCSCGGKLKTGPALSDHLRDSPKHKKPPIKGNEVPKAVAMETKPKSSALGKNTPASQVASPAPSVTKAAKVPLDQYTVRLKAKEPSPIVTTAEETQAKKLKQINANVKEAQGLHARLMAKLSELLEFEITKELKAEIKKEVKPVLKRELEDEIKAEFGGDLKKLKTEIMSDLILELKADFKNVVKEEIKNEFRMTVAYQLVTKDEAKTDHIDDLKSELKAELKIELMNEFKGSSKLESNGKSTGQQNGDGRICIEDLMTMDDMDDIVVL
ncbi:hypothetical protein VE03_09463 [Pseudogymnoascus sp. 23342-1-I1]|nr:hypothetical protein VE03_09463 [Pseudogymnoascus sp. 23342-1-I1]